MSQVEQTKRECIFEKVQNMLRKLNVAEAIVCGPHVAMLVDYIATYILDMRVYVGVNSFRELMDEANKEVLDQFLLQIGPSIGEVCENKAMMDSPIEAIYNQYGPDKIEVVLKYLDLFHYIMDN